MQSLTSAQALHGRITFRYTASRVGRRRAADGEADERRVRIAFLTVVVRIHAEMLEHQRMRPLAHDARRRYGPTIRRVFLSRSAIGWSA